jgi:hypothetical protein
MLEKSLEKPLHGRPRRVQEVNNENISNRFLLCGLHSQQIGSGCGLMAGSLLARAETLDSMIL